MAMQRLVAHCDYGALLTGAETSGGGIARCTAIQSVAETPTLPYLTDGSTESTSERSHATTSGGVTVWYGRLFVSLCCENSSIVNG